MPTKPPPVAAGSPARVLARLSRIVENSLAEDELTLPQYRLLAFLAQGDWAASVLADWLAVSRPSLTGLVDGLVRRGLVERRTGAEDRRRVEHALTPAGSAVLCRADQRADAAIDAVFGDMPGDVADAALGALRRLHEEMDARLQEKLR